jgi:hypothetical protein
LRRCPVGKSTADGSEPEGIAGVNRNRLQTDISSDAGIPPLFESCLDVLMTRESTSRRPDMHRHKSADIATSGDPYGR